jgi:uncharacterized iron-regulated protein
VNERRALAFTLALLVSACASAPRPEPWEERLRGDAIVLLGEVHDNTEQHRLRLALLRRAFAAGWRPALALEQLDRERQADVESARRERPDDPQHVLDRAATKAAWSWDSYRPFVALALEFDVPLVAANLSREDAKRIARGGFPAVFDAAQLAALGLDRKVASDWQAAQEREIDAGHCFALPPESRPALARAQLARDAVMAALLREHASRGVVLLAGNGHVRRDLGVPRWLPPELRGRTFAVGFLEEGDAAPDGAFDAVVYTPRAERPDPCAALRPRGSAPRRPVLARARADVTPADRREVVGRDAALDQHELLHLVRRTQRLGQLRGRLGHEADAAPVLRELGVGPVRDLEQILAL